MFADSRGHRGIGMFIECMHGCSDMNLCPIILPRGVLFTNLNLA